MVLACKRHSSAKKKKKIILEVVARRCSAKKLSKKFLKIRKEITVRQSLLKVFCQSGLQLIEERRPLLVFQSYSFLDPLENIFSLIIHKFQRKAPVFESLFKECLEADFHICFSK